MRNKLYRIIVIVMSVMVLTACSQSVDTVENENIQEKIYSIGTGDIVKITFDNSDLNEKYKLDKQNNLIYVENENGDRLVEGVFYSYDEYISTIRDMQNANNVLESITRNNNSKQGYLSVAYKSEDGQVEYCNLLEIEGTETTVMFNIKELQNFEIFDRLHFEKYEET